MVLHGVDNSFLTPRDEVDVDWDPAASNMSSCWGGFVCRYLAMIDLLYYVFSVTVEISSLTSHRVEIARKMLKPMGQHILLVHHANNWDLASSERRKQIPRQYSQEDLVKPSNETLLQNS